MPHEEGHVEEEIVDDTQEVNINFTFPPPEEISNQQQYLIDTQIALFQDSIRTLQAVEQEFVDFTPILHNALGVKKDANGNMVNMTADEFYNAMPAHLKPGYDIIRRNNDAILNAFDKGISPYLQEQFDQEFAQFKENAARFGHDIAGETAGSGFSRSTAGQQGLKNLAISQGIRGDEERRNFMTTLQGVNNQARQVQDDIQHRGLFNMQNFPLRRSAVLGNSGVNAASTISGIQGLNAGIEQQKQQGYGSLAAAGLSFLGNIWP